MTSSLEVGATGAGAACLSVSRLVEPSAAGALGSLDIATGGAAATTPEPESGSAGAGSTAGEGCAADAGEGCQVRSLIAIMLTLTER